MKTTRDIRGIGLLALAVASGAAACNSVDDRPAEWAYLSPAIFQPTCSTTSCHSRAVAVAGLDFSDPDRGYTSLTALKVWAVDVNGSVDAGCEPLGDAQIICPTQPRPFVVAFDPDESRLVNMLRARGAPRMPPDRPLPEKDIELVARWILDGARKTPNGPPANAADAGGGASGGDR